MFSIPRWITGCLLGLVCGTAIGNVPYKFVTEIPIGGEGGWDILTIDSAASRLYLSHATKVVVVDLIKNSSRRRNCRHAWCPRIRGRTRSATRFLIERQRIEIERRRSDNVEDDFENRYRIEIPTPSFTSRVMVRSTFSITLEIPSPLSMQKLLPSQRRFRSEELRNSRQ